MVIPIKNKKLIVLLLIVDDLISGQLISNHLSKIENKIFRDFATKYNFDITDNPDEYFRFKKSIYLSLDSQSTNLELLTFMMNSDISGKLKYCLMVIFMFIDSNNLYEKLHQVYCQKFIADLKEEVDLLQNVMFANDNIYFKLNTDSEDYKKQVKSYIEYLLFDDVDLNLFDFKEMSC